MSDFELNADNYYSDEANKRYMSVHQYMDFAGHLGVRGCEAKAMAKLKGEWKDETTPAMLLGSYVDSYFEGTLEQFQKEHPEIFLKDGKTLSANYRKAEKMIARCKTDDYFMSTLAGEKQRIMTASLFGCDWKIKMDSYIEDVAIVDLKTTSDLHKAWRVADAGYVCVPEYWGYTLQGALYQKIVEINTGKKLPFYLSFVTKDDVPEICVTNIDQVTLDNALNEIEMNMASVLSVWKGETEPIRCERCDYCKSTKKLTGAISIYDLINE